MSDVIVQSSIQVFKVLISTQNCFVFFPYAVYFFILFEGNFVRVDTTLKGFEQMNWQRGNQSFIFKAGGSVEKYYFSFQFFKLFILPVKKLSLC